MNNRIEIRYILRYIEDGLGLTLYHCYKCGGLERPRKVVVYEAIQGFSKIAFDKVMYSDFKDGSIGDANLGFQFDMEMAARRWQHGGDVQKVQGCARGSAWLCAQEVKEVLEAALLCVIWVMLLCVTQGCARGTRAAGDARRTCPGSGAEDWAMGKWRHADSGLGFGKKMMNSGFGKEVGEQCWRMVDEARRELQKGRQEKTYMSSVCGSDTMKK
ncbi:hypothetical protein U1Q18_012028 [Sarracenia purpurea var. burkii]